MPVLAAMAASMTLSDSGFSDASREEGDGSGMFVIGFS
jgi:hypothetical protein